MEIRERQGWGNEDSGATGMGKWRFGSGRDGEMKIQERQGWGNGDSGATEMGEWRFGSDRDGGMEIRERQRWGNGDLGAAGVGNGHIISKASLLWEGDLFLTFSHLLFLLPFHIIPFFWKQFHVIHKTWLQNTKYVPPPRDLNFYKFVLLEGDTPSHVHLLFHLQQGNPNDLSCHLCVTLAGTLQPLLSLHQALRREFFFESSPSERFANVVFVIHLRRRYTFYIMNVILPSLMTSILLLSVFFCTPAQKVQIGVVVLLSFRIFLLNVTDSIPRTSDHIPVLGESGLIMQSLRSLVH